MEAWVELNRADYDLVWDRFDAKFKFQPNYHERAVPAISEPSPSVTFDLSIEVTESNLEAINNIFLNAFRDLVSNDGRLFVLDWQHTSYSFYPHRQNGEWEIGIFPDGDYYIFLAEDFSFGTFGHPWQLSLCVFGRPLLDLIDCRLQKQLKLLRSSDG